MTDQLPDALVAELQEFLAGFKNAESLTPSLSAGLSVDTGLEEALVACVDHGCDVVIAGSAGGGKTHLLRAVRDHPGMRPFVEWPHENEPTDGPFVRVVADATPLGESVAQVFDNRPATCVAVLVAINEG